MSRAYIARSKRNDWLTPEGILHLVRGAFAGQIELDPCGNRKSLVRAKRQYLLSCKEDGLMLPWRGKVFVNPPFADVGTWLYKASIEAERIGGEIIFLMPSRTDTKAWQEVVPTAQAVCFWKGRIRFVGAPASAPCPTALIYWGRNASRFNRVFAPYGTS